MDTTGAAFVGICLQLLYLDCLCLDHQVAKDLGDKVQILKLDVDKNPKMSTRLQVGGRKGAAVEHG